MATRLSAGLEMMLLWVGLGLLGVAEAINPGGFPNDITAPIRGWRSWNVRQPQSAPPQPGGPLAALTSQLVQAVFSDVTQSFIERQIDGIVDRRFKGHDGRPTSLWSAAPHPASGPADGRC